MVVNHYELFVAYLRGREVQTEPVPGFPDALRVVGPVPTNSPLVLRSGARQMTLKALRNPNPLFARLQLPSDRPAEESP